MQFYRRHALTGVTRETFAFLFRNPILTLAFWVGAIAVYLAADWVIFDTALVEFIEGRFFSGDIDYGVYFTTGAINTLGIAVLAVPMHNWILSGALRVQFLAAANIIIYWLLQVVILALISTTFTLLVTTTTGVTVEFNAAGAQRTIVDPSWYFPARIAAIATIFCVALFLTVKYACLLPSVATSSVGVVRWRQALELSDGWFWRIFIRMLRVGAILYAVNWLIRLLPSEAESGLPLAYWSYLLSDGASLVFMVTLSTLIFRRLSEIKEGG